MYKIHFISNPKRKKEKYIATKMMKKIIKHTIEVFFQERNEKKIVWSYARQIYIIVVDAVRYLYTLYCSIVCTLHKTPITFLVLQQKNKKKNSSNFYCPFPLNRIPFLSFGKSVGLILGFFFLSCFISTILYFSFA